LRKQNCKLISRDGSYAIRHITPEERRRLVEQGQARRVSRAKESPQRVSARRASRGLEFEADQGELEPVRCASVGDPATARGCRVNDG
jgi:hypothetical protein